MNQHAKKWSNKRRWADLRHSHHHLRPARIIGTHHPETTAVWTPLREYRAAYSLRFNRR